MVGVQTSRPLLDAPEPGSVAAAAGFESGDLILAIDGEDTPTLESAVLTLIDQALDGGVLPVTVRTESGAQRMRELDLRALDPVGESELFRALGLRPWRPDLPPVIDRVVPDSAAEAAGLQSGDRVLAVDGQSVQDWQAWAEYVRERPQQTLQLRIERDGTPMEMAITPQAVETGSGTIGRVGASVRIPAELDNPARFTLRYDPLAALWQGVVKTWDMSVFTLKMLGRMLVGQASLENISGPITIAQYAGQTATIGLAAFLSFMALVSISLGVLNLLPIPVLDGGHLLYYLIELLRGRPLSEAAQFAGQRLGLAVIVMLMGLALFNDVARLFS